MNLLPYHFSSFSWLHAENRQDAPISTCGEEHLFRCGGPNGLNQMYFVSARIRHGGLTSRPTFCHQLKGGEKHQRLGWVMRAETSRSAGLQDSRPAGGLSDFAPPEVPIFSERATSRTKKPIYRRTL